MRTKWRGRSKKEGRKSINYYLCEIEADKFISNIYLRPTNGKRKRTSIYDRYEIWELKWAAKKGFRNSIKSIDPNDSEKLRRLIENYDAVKKILKYRGV